MPNTGSRSFSAELKINPAVVPGTNNFNRCLAPAENHPGRVGFVDGVIAAMRIQVRFGQIAAIRNRNFGHIRIQKTARSGGIIPTLQVIEPGLTNQAAADATALPGCQSLLLKATPHK